MTMSIPAVKLNKLLEQIAEYSANPMISSLAIDSRMVNSGTLFIAYPGSKLDRRDFIDVAVKAGAVAILVEAEGYQPQHYDIPIISIEGLIEKVGVIASRFYDFPSSKMKLVGVTGTNGKSSIVFLASQSLTQLGHSAAMLGTLGCGIAPNFSPMQRTTPDSITLQGLLANWCSRVETTLMEVSSHALAQSRVNGVEFDVAVFTNLGTDHLEDHGGREAYQEAKKRLFQFSTLSSAIINLDDEFGQQLVSDIPNAVNCYGYTLDEVVYQKYRHALPCLHAESKWMSDLSWHIDVRSPWGEGQLTTSLLGRFNIANLMASLALLCLLGAEFAEAMKQLACIEFLPGRMERYQRKGKPLVVVDYAHTPEALDLVLQALKPNCTGNLIAVFGCGGNRDKSKRVLMGEVAAQYADKIILTSDNCRAETAESIMADIRSGMGDKTPSMLVDRSEAIVSAFHTASPEDVILIAGKGHETYQEIDGEFFPFSDRELAARLVSGGDI